MQDRRTTDRSRRADNSPLIPCSECGRYLRYTRAAPRRFAAGGIGYCHPGECDPADVVAWRSLTVTFHRRVWA